MKTVKTVRKKASAVTGVSGFFSGKTASSVAIPFTDVEAQDPGYVFSDEASVRTLSDPDSTSSSYYAGAEERPSSQRVLRPIRKAAAKVTGVGGFFSGKDPTSESVREPPVAHAVTTDIGLQQSLIRGTMVVSNANKHEDAGCCNGFLGPLMMTNDGAAERLQVRQIVPWAAVTITGIFITFHAVLSLIFLYLVFFATNDNSYSYSLYGSFFGPVPYLICWIFGFRLALASCPGCKTQVPLPLWHRLLSAVPIAGIAVLITYAPWLMMVTTAITALPHYITNILYLQSHEATLVDLLSALSALLLIILTPAHIVVMVSLRNDRRLGTLNMGGSRSTSPNTQPSSLHRATSLRRSPPRSTTSRNTPPRTRSLSDMSTTSGSSTGTTSTITSLLQGSSTPRNRSRTRSRSRSRSPSAGRSMAMLSRGISKLYMKRLIGVLVATSGPLLLDFIQCLPLLAAHFFDKGDNSINHFFLPLLAAFFLPRFLLLGLSKIMRRVRYDKIAGTFVETFEYCTILSAVLGFGKTEFDNEVWEAEMRALDPLWNLRFGPLGICSGRCIISVRYMIASALVVVFPHTVSLFLILDNVAKVAASGGRITNSTIERPDRASSDRSRSDKEGVDISKEDHQNAQIFALYLMIAYGSQLLVCYAYGWPLLYQPDNIGDYHRHGLTTALIWFELIIALLTSLAATNALGTRVWRRVRVVFVNRASLWLSAKSRDRPVPVPNRVLSPELRPSLQHPQVVESQVAVTTHM